MTGESRAAELKIWYDAGNIITTPGRTAGGARADRPARHRLCAKDCMAIEAEVMSQFGTGKVDFKAVVRQVEIGRFNGPSCRGRQVGATAEEDGGQRDARKTEFLERRWLLVD